jgi:hypothetical protein
MKLCLKYNEAAMMEAKTKSSKIPALGPNRKGSDSLPQWSKKLMNNDLKRKTEKEAVHE